VSRPRLLGLLAAILCVALAAALLRTSEAALDHQVVRGRLEQPVRVGTGEVVVDQVRVADRLSGDSSVAGRTPGLFVVVRVDAAAPGTEEFRLDEARLLTRGDRIYAPYQATFGLDAPPGFADRADLVFEVDPAGIAGLTLELWQSELVSGYQARVQVPLGITAANAGAWRDAGVRTAVEPDIYGRTRALT